MGYYNKTKVIASTSGRPIIGPVILVTDTEPTTRINGDALVIGDAWWDPTTTTLSNYLPDDQGVYSWVAVDGSSDLANYYTKTEVDDMLTGDALRTSLGIVSAGNDEDAEGQGINVGDMYYNSTFGKYIARS